MDVGVGVTQRNFARTKDDHHKCNVLSQWQNNEIRALRYFSFVVAHMFFESCAHLQKNSHQSRGISQDILGATARPLKSCIGIRING